MLSLYRPPKGSDLGSEEVTVIPAGTPYLTRVKGQLVMVRHKKDTKIRGVTIKGARGSSVNILDLTRPREAAVNFLGEAFGVRARIPRSRTKSLERPSPLPSADARFLYPGPQSSLAGSTPLAHQAIPTVPGFVPVSVIPQPVQYAIVQPQLEHRDLEQLRYIDAHYRSISGGLAFEVNPSMASRQRLDPKPGTTVLKHTCGNCGRIRSRRYYAEHPIKPGEIPIQEFCAKCQRDASSTSSSRSSYKSCAKRHATNKQNASRRTKGLAQRGTSANEYMGSKEPIVQKKSESKESIRESESGGTKSTNHQSGCTEQKKKSRVNPDSRDQSANDLRTSLYESSGEDMLERGRSRPRERKWKLSTSASPATPSDLKSSQADSRRKPYGTTPILTSRLETKIDVGSESPMTVNAYIPTNADKSYANNRYTSFQKGSLLQYNESHESHDYPGFSSDDEIPDESSLCRKFRGGRDDDSKGYSSWTQELDQLSHEEHYSPAKGTMSSDRNRSVFCSQSEGPDSWAAYDKRQKGGQGNRYHGDSFTPTPGAHYTHYYSDWSAASSAQITQKSDKRELSRQTTEYRRNIYHDPDLSSSEDQTRETRSSSLSFSILPPAPTPTACQDFTLPATTTS